MASNSWVFCPCWPFNSLWLQMNWKHNTVATVWHFPLLGRVNPYLCQWRPVCQTIATATSVLASALHSWKHHHLLALPIKSPLSWRKWAVEMICCLPTCTFINRISASTNVTTPFSHSSAPLDTRPVTPLVFYFAEAESSAVTNIIIMFLNEYFTLICMSYPGGVKEGVGKGSSLCADLCFHARYLNVHFSESWTQVIFSCPPVLAEHHPLTGRTSGKEDWHRALAVCYHPKYSLLSRMTQRFIRTNFRIVWIRWVSQLSRLGCGSLLDNTDPISKNPKNSFLSSCPA